MKSLVLYDSNYGNTKIIAETIAGVLGAELALVTDFNLDGLTGVELLVVGSPIHAWHASSATANFLNNLEKNTLKGKFVAAFDTGYDSKLSGNAATKIQKGLTRAGGKSLIATHKFIVTGSEGPLGPDEVTRASEWANDLKINFEEANKLTAGSVF